MIGAYSYAALKNKYVERQQTNVDPVTTDGRRRSPARAGNGGHLFPVVPHQDCVETIKPLAVPRRSCCVRRSVLKYPRSAL